jgi:adenylate cyclase
VRLIREGVVALPRECQSVRCQGTRGLGVAMTPVSTNATRKLPDWLSAEAGWLPTPASADFDARRAHAIGRLAPVGLVIHALYVPLFAWWGVWPLALYNVLSTVVFALVMLMAHRGQIQRGLSLTGAEVFVHALLAILLIGWGFGGQYYLLLFMVFVFVFPSRRLFQLTVLAATIALFVAGYYYTQRTVPPFEVPSAPLAVLYVLNVAAVFGCVAFAVSYAMAVAERAENALATEHARSERLLTNVLPVPIAARLKEHEEVIADGVDGASVLFADIVGFTVLSAQRTPDEVVAMLNGVFTRLDGLVDEYGLEKIKTIGDAYMVAAGIPVPREDHARVLARFALAARDELAEHNLTADVPVELRIGINSGPVVAGVIGKRRFLYDLWGDTVNTASRMESHGLPGQIQITDATRALLDGEFSCTERGVVDVKGKGPTRTWLLEGERSPALTR